MSGTTKPSVVLPDIPESPIELEDCAAALYSAAGFFVEQNVTEQDVLELDAVATSYDSDAPRQTVVEAKSGDWGYADAFKVLGWMRYLDVPDGTLFYLKKGDNEVETMAERLAPYNVRVVGLATGDQPAAFVVAGLGAVRDTEAYGALRFTYPIQRAMVKVLRGASKQSPPLEGARAALDYHRLVNDRLFFEPDLRKRLFQLYDDFGRHPRLALGVARELDGQAFDPSSEAADSDALRAAIYHGQNPVVLAAAYVEHRARLLVLKTAIDLALIAPPPKAVLKSKGVVVFTDDDYLPGSFRKGLAELQKHSGFSRYAVLWQHFIFTLGGFYLEDRKEQEFEWLATLAGIAKEDVALGLTAFDALFPTPKSWFVRAYDSQATLLRLVPMPFQGLGAYYRLRRLGLKTIADFGYTDHTRQDLVKWYNNAYECLVQLAKLKTEGTP